VGGVPAVGHGQFPKHWDGIRGGRKVGFSVPTSNLTLKKGLGKQKIKKRMCLGYTECPTTGTARHTLISQTRPKHTCSHLQPEGHRTALSPCISHMMLTGEIVWLFYELPGGCERGGEQGPVKAHLIVPGSVAPIRLRLNTHHTAK